LKNINKMKNKKTRRRKDYILLILIISFAIFFLFAGLNQQDWRTANMESANIAPLPENEPQAIVHIYAARAFNWRGYFSVHTWLAVKEKNAKHYTTLHVIGFYTRGGGNSVVIHEDIPDRHWYGAVPYLVYELKGQAAEAAIPKILKAANDYPDNKIYRIWPGPNSNTFTSYIIRKVLELTVELPSNAIGKDWLTDGSFFARSESGTGYQFSFYGAFGLTVGKAEGIELNLLGLNFGVDILRPALKLPFVGRVGMQDSSVSK
jgi:hypothetical protein